MGTGKRYLVTGGAGFIGSHLVDVLMEDETVENVTVLDSLTYAGDRRNLSRHEGSSRFKLVIGSVLNSSLVRDLLGERPSGVFHLAAESHVDRSIQSALSFIDTNIKGAYVVMEASRHEGVRCVCTSTDEVYGDSHERGLFTEEMLPVPSSPYSWSKACMDLWRLVVERTFSGSVSPIMTRGCNHFGPRQQWEKFIPRVIAAGLENQPVAIYGDGKQQRTWIHVRDGARALYHVMLHGEDGVAYNLGLCPKYGQTVTNVDMATRLLRLIAPNREPMFKYVADRPGHDRTYVMMTSLLEGLGPTGWGPELGQFDQQLRETVEWYRASENYEWVVQCRKRDDEFRRANYEDRGKQAS